MNDLEFIALPRALVFAAGIPKSKHRTLLLLAALAYEDGSGNTETAPVEFYFEILELSQSQLYEHLAYLRSSGWIEISRSARGMAVSFKRDPRDFRIPGIRNEEEEELILKQLKLTSSSYSGKPDSQEIDSGKPESPRHKSNYDTLIRSGVYPSVAEYLCKEDWIHPDYIRAHILYGKKKHLDRALTVWRMKQGAPAPEICLECNAINGEDHNLDCETGLREYRKSYADAEDPYGDKEPPWSKF